MNGSKLICPRCGDYKSDDRQLLCDACRQYMLPAKSVKPMKSNNSLCRMCGRVLRRDSKSRLCWQCTKEVKRRSKMDPKEYDTEAAAAAQTNFCDLNKLPIFAPRDGCCWHCGRNIYDVGCITVKQAGERLITSCPHCNYSFVE